MRYCSAAILAASAWSALAQDKYPNSAPSAKQGIPASGQVNIFAFGSSWTDNKFQQDDRQPSPEYPLGNPGFQDTNNAQNGPNYLRYLTEQYNTTTTLLYDFGRGGATIDNSVMNSGPPDLVHQVSTNFTPKYSTQKDKLWTSDNTVFNVWMCDNDILLGLNHTDHDKLVDELMHKYWDVAIDQLYKEGARKFMFVDAPPQDRSPKILQNDAKSDIPKYLDLKWKLDDALWAKVQEFQANHTADVKTAFFNASAFLNPVLDNPTQYGFNADITCTLDKTKDCIWNNEFHMVPKAHELMAEGMATLYKDLGL